jgi:hypothetical protein
MLRVLELDEGDGALGSGLRLREPVESGAGERPLVGREEV